VTKDCKQIVETLKLRANAPANGADC
jgi:hypothetical protein